MEFLVACFQMCSLHLHDKGISNITIYISADVSV